MGVGGWLTSKRYGRLWGMTKLFYTFTVAVVTQMYTVLYILYTLKVVKLIAYKLYLNLTLEKSSAILQNKINHYY